MAAVFRYAAKRLGGGVIQRSQSVEGRRLPTRLLNATPTKATTVADDTQAVVSRLFQIQVKKEELYSLVADFERTYKAPLRISWQNGELLHRLSTQIEPRPSDPYWRMCRSTQRKISFFSVVGLFTSALSSAYAIAYVLLWLKKNYAKDLEDWWNKQISCIGKK